MKTIKGFDAVAASRRWKEAVARQTEGLKPDQVIAFFEKESVLTAMQTLPRATSSPARVREEPSQG